MDHPAVPGLHDIHLPPSPGWWPPAPGWWLLAALLVGAASWIAWNAWRARRRRQRIAAALREFDGALDIAQDAPARLAAASSLLRRATLLRHASAASLDGAAWLRFLDGDDVDKPFSTGAGVVLVDGAFRRHVDGDIAPALELARSRFAALLAQGRGDA